MDFRPAQVVQTALQDMLDHGVLMATFGDTANIVGGYPAVVDGEPPWLEIPQQEWIFTTHGLVNGYGQWCV